MRSAWKDYSGWSNFISTNTFAGFRLRPFPEHRSGQIESLSRYRSEVEGISGLAPALPVSASWCCELWLSTAPGATNKHFVTSPSFPLSSAFSDTSTLILTACYFKMLSPCCKHVKLGDVSLFPLSLLFNPVGCTPNSQPFSKSPFIPFHECYYLISSPPHQLDTEGDKISAFPISKIHPPHHLFLPDQSKEPCRCCMGTQKPEWAILPGLKEVLSGTSPSSLQHPTPFILHASSLPTSPHDGKMTTLILLTMMVQGTQTHKNKPALLCQQATCVLPCISTGRTWNEVVWFPESCWDL